MQQRSVAMDQIISAEDPIIVHPDLTLWFQTKTDLSQTKSVLIFPDPSIHLGEGVLDQL